MTNVRRIIDLPLFIDHCYKYGFLLRSSDRPRLGPPLIRICDNLVVECLRSTGAAAAASDRRIFLPGVEVPSPSAEILEDDPRAHRANAERFLASKDSPLRSSAMKNEPFTVIQGFRCHATSASASLTSFPHLSVIRYFPLHATLSRVAQHRRKRLRFYRRYAELPGDFAIDDDGGLIYRTHGKRNSTTSSSVGGREPEEDADEMSTHRTCGKAKAASFGVSVYEEEDGWMQTLNEKKGFLLERVLPFSSSLLPSRRHDGALQLVEYHVDVEKAALSFLLDAYRIWQIYRNFSLHFRLAPTKAIIVTRQEDAKNETVAAVIDWIREDLEEKQKLPCDYVVIDEDADAFTDDDCYDDDDNDDDSLETGAKPTLNFLMRKNGVGVPFFISIDKNVMKTGIVKLFQRETRLAEEIHIEFLVKKLAAYLNAV